MTISPQDVENDAYDVWKNTQKIEIPESWSNFKLHELGKIQGGGTPRKSVEKYWNGEVPWVTPKDMKVDYISTSKLKVTEVGVTESSAKFIDENSLLFVVRGMILAHSFPVAQNLKPVTVNQDMKSLSPRESVNADYLLYALKSLVNVFVELASSSTHGTKRLEAKIYNNVAVPIPPEKEQKEIARIVSELLAKAEVIEKQYKAAKLRIDKLVQSILARAFNGKLFSSISEDEREEVEVKSQPKQEITGKTELVQENIKAQADKIENKLRSQVKLESTPTHENNSAQAGEVFTLLKSNNKGMSAQALFDGLSDNTFSAIDDIFSELKKLIEKKAVIQDGEGENSTFKVIKK